MENVSIFLLAIICSLICVTIRQHSEEFSFLLSILAGAFIVVAVLSKVSPVISHIKNLMSNADISSSYTDILIKCLGICILAQFSSDSCRDSGQTALASKLEFAGKVMVAVVALPLFEKIIQITEKLLVT